MTNPQEDGGVEPDRATLMHVCLFRLSRPLLPSEVSALQRFEGLFREDPGCVHYRFHHNTSQKASGFDLVLMSAFRGQAALRAYVASHAHAEIATLMDAFVTETVVADFEDLIGVDRPGASGGAA